jgi:phage shock protein A
MAKALRAVIESTIEKEQVSAAEPIEETVATDSEGEVEHGADEQNETGALEERPETPDSAGDTGTADAGEPGTEKAGVEQNAAATSPYAKPPASWKGDAKQVWDALPEKARREVVRREKQIDRTLNETAQIRQNYEQVSQVVQQFEPRLREWNVPAATAFRQFMDTDRVLAQGGVSAAQKMADLIKAYNIDFRALDAALVGSAPPRDMEMEQRIQQLVDQRTAPLLQRYQQETEHNRQAVIETIHSMENNPEYPYFEEVREEMADLIELNASRGEAISLADAYNRVTGYRGYARPAPNSQKTQQAINASLSVSGAPAAVTNQGNPANLRATLEKAFGG